MFERYTEGARRVIFFARFEASVLGSPSIETEHLLLGLVKEDLELLQRLVGTAVTEETFRTPILANAAVRDTINTSVDMPLANDGKRVLAYAAEEAERLEDRLIRTGHLLLGLMREEGSVAQRLLATNGAKLKAMRTRLAAEPKTMQPVNPPVRGDRPGLGAVAGARTEFRHGSFTLPPEPAEPIPVEPLKEPRFERYSEKARRVIFFARYDASHFGQGIIEPEHLLLGMIREAALILYELLGVQVPWAEMRTRIEEKLDTANPLLQIMHSDLPLSAAAIRVLETAADECDQLGGGLVGIGHLLLGLLNEKGSFAAELLRDRGADPQAIRAKLKSLGQ